jgi:4'-phosphopantetheinyl transferase
MLAVTSLPPIAPGQRLVPGAVHLWCFFYEGLSLARYDALISPAERERLSRLHFERDREIFVATRALVRTVLSEYAAGAPDSWQFAQSPTGKPRLVGLDIEFNLSHTRGLVACAVSQHRVGVDVERIEPGRNLDALARRYFSTSEVDALFALPPGERAEHFFRFWTLKESFLKARGDGLSASLDWFSFALDSDPIRVSFTSGTGDSPENWRFASLRGSDVHTVGIAAETTTHPLALSAARYVPLQGILPNGP